MAVERWWTCSKSTNALLKCEADTFTTCYYTEGLHKIMAEKFDFALDNGSRRYLLLRPAVLCYQCRNEDVHVQWETLSDLNTASCLM